LPKRFDVGSGFIIDGFDTVSKQTDVIVYDALNCPVYRASEDAAIFPSDNVAAVVEVKSRLDQEQLTSAFENILATKQLAKTLPPNSLSR
jgi:predicted dinucleotide-binding enzyme